MKKLLVLMPALGISYCVTAQQLSPDIVANAGGHDKAAGLSLEWTLGEAVVETVPFSGELVTQGFHQPMLQVFPVQETEAGTALGFMVAPNPVEAGLTITLPPDLNERIAFTLTDMNGKALLAKTAAANTRQQELDLATFAAGLYFLHVRNAAGVTLQTFKIIKTH